MDKWLDLFNYGTLPFYWGGFKPEEGSPHTEQLRKAAEFLNSRDVKVKGHPLCWHTGCVLWLMNYGNAITRICKKLGRVGLVREVFQATKESNPDGIFLITDFNMSYNYEILIDGCLNAGAPNWDFGDGAWLNAPSGFINLTGFKGKYEVLADEKKVMEFLLK